MFMAKPVKSTHGWPLYHGKHVLSPKKDLESINHRTDGYLAQINVSEISLHYDTKSDTVVVYGQGGEKQNQEPSLIEN